MQYFVQIKMTKGKGRGVFATKNFVKDEIIEICPIIFLDDSEAKYCDPTILGHYMYEWNHEHDGALPLGYGLLYNHSFTPNAVYERDFANNQMLYKAIKNIKTGEEILINYNGEPDNMDPYHFTG